MNKKSILISCFLSLLIISFIVIDNINNDEKKVFNANTLYKIYLKGNELGYIDDDNTLYNLINEEQQEIKEQYGVDNVYPPSDFDIVKVNTYKEDLTDVNKIYNDIESYDNFTIKGYTATIKVNDNPEDDIEINVLDKEVFDEAIDTFINAFIEAETYNNYINGTQEEIIDYGEIINNMYFAENISIKENYINVNDKIYTDVNDLTQFLLFGKDAVMNIYVVEVGDTITSIAESNKLNTKEFLVANPEFRSSDALLAIGQEVNVTLLDPILDFVYEISVTEEVEVDFITTTVIDNTKSVGYSEPTVAGVKGLQKVTSNYAVINGLPSKEIESTAVVIREVVNAVTTVGPSYSGSSSMSNYVYTGLNFALPTLPGFVISSPFNEWRDGYAHKGTDFSGTGHNSPIFAIASGVVTQAGWGSGGQGNYVVISHGNGYYSNYLHMVTGSLLVGVGDTVTAGQKIGGMGNTGWSSGTHLHLEFTRGEPYTGQSVTYYNAYNIIFGG